MKKLSILFIFILMIININASNAENYIIEINSVSQSYLEVTPWQRTAIRNNAGFGVSIQGKYVLTTADVVKDSMLVELKKHGENTIWTGKVLHADYDAGLALVIPDNVEFFNTLETPEFSDNYRIGSNIILSRRLGDGRLASYSGLITEIFATRILYGSNTYIALKGSVMMQSGGNGEIIFSDGKIIGLCYSFRNNEANIIPYETIKNYLTNFNTGNYRGFPANYFSRTLMNDINLRKYLKFPDELSGVMIGNYLSQMPYASFFKQYDILLSVDGFNIDNAGLVTTEKYGKIAFNVILNLNKKPGESVNVEIFRNGKVEKHKLKLESYDKDSYLIPEHLIDKRANYIVYGGLLISELTKSFLQEYGSEWVKRGPVSLVKTYYDFFMKKSPDKNRIVVVRQVFPHDINRGYQHIRNQVISTINGIKIKDISDVEKALSLDVEYDVFEFEKTAFKVVFNRQEVSRTNHKIEETYTITESRFIEAR